MATSERLQYASPSELIALGDGGPLPHEAETLAHRRFERFAAAEPDLTAIVTRDGTLTYGELNSRADAVAWRLHELGVGRESIVGICLPHRLDALIAIYGVLKAGAAYLPLDVGQPLPRRRFMLDDTKAAALITTPAIEEDLAGGSLRVLTWEENGPTAPATARVGSVAGPSLDDLAYVIYTSGSTGKPKGVMIEHRSLAAFVHWGISAFSWEELQRVFAATSFGFDMSLFELMVPFAAGGSLILADNFLEIARAHRDRPTLVNTVPSLMATALSETTLPESVRTAVFCGETLPPDVAEKVHTQPGVTRVVNAYGPTEDTVYSTAAEVPAGQRPTCGRAFPGTQVYLLDADLELVPYGEPGEICLGGAGLARGYLGREDLTRERFVERPLGDDGPARVYRTGDLGRWEEDGSLQHLGRLDHQIKLRGVRIEPAEIEDALTRLPGVRQAVVVARERPSGGKWLVAYITCAEGSEADGRSLREALRGTLPGPMVPSAFVKLDEMPLNPNGKLDRARLPEPPSAVTAASELEGDELALGELWREVLHLDGLPAPDDDFFELGGDSLLAFKLFDRIAERFGTELPPSLLVQASTLRPLALWIDAAEFAEGRVVVELHTEGKRIPCFYVHSGAGGILALRNFATTFGPDQPLYGIQAFRDDDTELGRVPLVSATGAECVPLVRQRQPTGPYIIAGHSIGGHIAYELACRLQAEGEEVLYLGLLDPAAPHTLKWHGRIAARASELIGTGPEPRRSRAIRSALSKVRRRLRGSVRGATGQQPAANDPDRPSQWMKNLAAIEKRYSPPTFSGPTTIYRTVEMARYTGSASLGWDRYVDGPIETRRVPGGHVSLLLDPNVDVVAREMEADIRSAQQHVTPDQATV
jgi:amino acid adenylation domain-containing protein